MMAPMNPYGICNKKYPWQEETSDQLPVPKRPPNSRQPSRQRSQSVTIQDEDVIKAPAPQVPLSPCPPSSSKGAWMPMRLVSTPSSTKSRPSSSNRATNSRKSSTTSLANEIQTIVTMKTTTSNEVT